MSRRQILRRTEEYESLEIKGSGGIKLNFRLQN